jgi:hypothetical protein
MGFPEAPQSFDLLKLVERAEKSKDAEGRDVIVKYWAPADENEGEWRCERHRPETAKPVKRTKGRFEAVETA